MTDASIYPASPRFKNIIRKTFHRLTAIKYVGRSKHGKAVWLFQCSCGNLTTKTGSSATSGNAKSCGCLKKDVAKTISATHGMSKTPVYKIWRGMVSRCTLPKATGYKNYGGRGISVCNDWLNFTAFYADMGAMPSSKHSIERRDNEAGYCPSNCFWATRSEQSRNTRKSHRRGTGVSQIPSGNWIANIGVNRERIHLGTYDTFDLAVEAREAAKKIYW